MNRARAIVAASPALPFVYPYAPAVDLNFAQGLYSGADSSGLSVTRALAGYGLTAAGTLTSFSTNTARITDRGLLIEEARTNTILQSQTFGTSWTAAGVAVSADQIAAPDGTTTADLLTEDSSTGFHRLTLAIGGYAGSQPISLSVYAKANLRTRLAVTTGGVGFTFNSVVFNLSSGTVQSGSGGTIQALANGWYRCINTTTTSAGGGNGTTQIEICDDAGTRSYAGNGTGSVYVWGAQVEVASTASSYIPTTTVAVARPADAITGPSALVAVLGSATGYLYAELGPTASSTAAGIIGYNAGGRGALLKNSGNTAGTTWNGAGTALDTANSATWTKAVTKVAVSWSAAGRLVCLDGGAVATDANTVEAVTSVILGALSSGSYINGELRRVVAGTQLLTSAQLQQVTV